MAEVRDRIYLMQLCLRFFFFFTKAVETFGMPYVRLRWRNAFCVDFVIKLFAANILKRSLVFSESANRN